MFSTAGACTLATDESVFLPAYRRGGRAEPDQQPVSSQELAQYLPPPDCQWQFYVRQEARDTQSILPQHKIGSQNQLGLLSLLHYEEREKCVNMNTL